MTRYFSVWLRADGGKAAHMHMFHTGFCLWQILPQLSQFGSREECRILFVKFGCDSIFSVVCFLFAAYKIQ